MLKLLIFKIKIMQLEQLTTHTFQLHLACQFRIPLIAVLQQNPSKGIDDGLGVEKGTKFLALED